MTEIEAKQLDLIFSALASSTRRQMLDLLVEGKATVNELAEPFDMSLPAISKHIRVLERAGLVRRGKDAQFRPCVLNSATLEAIAHWTDQYRHIWSNSFDKIDELVLKEKDDGHD